MRVGSQLAVVKVIFGDHLANWEQRLELVSALQSKQSNEVIAERFSR